MTPSESETTQLTTSGFTVTDAADNTVLKAHAALERACQRRLPTRIHLPKRIPPGSGRGGASSDAAAALRGLKALHHLDDLDLAPIAAQVGSDVPYFLHGGRMLAEGRGEKLTPLPTKPATYLVAWPRIELSTTAVYAAWDEVKGDQPNELARAAQHFDNRVREFAEKLGNGWRMTGSGSAFFRETETDDAPDIKVWTTVAHAVGPWS